MPVKLPAGVEANVASGTVRVKGKKGELSCPVPAGITLTAQDGVLKVNTESTARTAGAVAGTMRARLQNMVDGVSKGFEKKLEIVGVGYRAQLQGKVLNLSLGFSHPLQVAVPAGITIETPSQTEIIIKGADLQQVGQLAADIRAYRPPEPYKGKGVRYANEKILRKEAKKA
jgi:large subunit ribosomal protein L6